MSTAAAFDFLDKSRACNLLELARVARAISYCADRAFRVQRMARNQRELLSKLQQNGSLEDATVVHISPLENRANEAAIAHRHHEEVSCDKTRTRFILAALL